MSSSVAAVRRAGVGGLEFNDMVAGRLTRRLQVPHFPLSKFPQDKRPWSRRPQRVELSKRGTSVCQIKPLYSWPERLLIIHPAKCVTRELSMHQQTEPSASPASPAAQGHRRQLAPNVPVHPLPSFLYTLSITLLWISKFICLQHPLSSLLEG